MWLGRPHAAANNWASEGCLITSSSAQAPLPPPQPFSHFLPRSPNRTQPNLTKPTQTHLPPPQTRTNTHDAPQPPPPLPPPPLNPRATANPNPLLHQQSPRLLRPPVLRGTPPEHHRPGHGPRVRRPQRRDVVRLFCTSSSSFFSSVISSSVSKECGKPESVSAALGVFGGYCALREGGGE